MKRISIYGKNRSPEIDPKTWATDFDFIDIFNSIKPFIEGSFIVPVELQFSYMKVNDDQKWDEYIETYFENFSCSNVDEIGNGPVGYTTFSNLEKYAEFLEGDWTDVFFFKSEEDAKLNIEPEGKEIPNGCFLLFECVDAGHWNVFTDNDEIVKTVLRDFKFIRDNAYSGYELNKQ